ncbi:hypothetical protein OG453_38430 [Streptomyces sp. NBC_01381]|uniref:DUF7691 family protein n=1 Tax=Streptomyces sp. NBC_01381 TaxID=2903845 RepID=UPI00225813EF|nr:hypothetical protein [Streptomyces sp. NBC_01381]MCX4672465.1 hypothetical protein [Streptomyces sp. NBC_01381]
MHIVIDSSSSDSMDLAVYSKPATFFDALDSELRRVGVSADLLPGQYVMGGLPQDFPFALPLPEHAVENFGFWPLEKTGPAADAYRAVLDRIEEGFTYDLRLLIDRLEHENGQERPSIPQTVNHASGNPNRPALRGGTSWCRLQS